MNIDVSTVGFQGLPCTMLGSIVWDHSKFEWKTSHILDSKVIFFPKSCDLRNYGNLIQIFSYLVNWSQ